MAKINDVRDRLARLLDNKEPLETFEDWFVQNSWNIHHQDDPELRRIVHAIELRLSEFSSGHLTESNLRRELLPFVTSVTTSLNFGGAPTSEVQPMEVNWMVVGQLRFGDPAGKESEVVFG